MSNATEKAVDVESICGEFQPRSELHCCVSRARLLLLHEFKGPRRSNRDTKQPPDRMLRRWDRLRTAISRRKAEQVASTVARRLSRRVSTRRPQLY